jgi:DNA topoisomerase VI subunit B
MPATLTRTTFTMSRALEFFSERELIMQMGFERRAWPIALLKELIDNSLDACESAGVAPHITVEECDSTLTVQDNGPGLPVSTLERSLDYMIRASDKAHYVSPSRGQLGNALKCVWAAPYVMSPEHTGRVDVATNSTRYQIDVRLDPLAQAPQLTMTAHPDAMIKTGTAITIHWPQPLAPCGRAGASIFIIRTPCSRGMPSSTPMYT